MSGPPPPTLPTPHPTPTPTLAPAAPGPGPASASATPVPLVPPPFAPPGFLLPPVPPPWTEHRAPAGQPYWFNPITNVSTYVRPLPPPAPVPPGVPPMLNPPPLHFPSASTSSVPTKKEKEKKEKKEKPKTKLEIEGTDWIEVTTNQGNVFWSNKATKQSVWTVPKEVKELMARKEREEKAEGEAGRKRKAAEEGGAEETEEEAEKKEESTTQKEDAPTTTNEVPSAPTNASDSAAPPKKKKKSKVVVVHDIEEMEQDEDWQRQIAEEMAREVEEQQKQQEQEEQQQQPPDHVGRSVGRPQAAAAPLGGLDVSAEEGMALFKVGSFGLNLVEKSDTETLGFFRVQAMLGEKEINPMAPWDMELPKFINDPRYTAVKQLKDRRDLFEEFCKEKLREIRAAKAKAAAEGSLPKLDPLTSYRELLETAVTSTRTHYSDFKRRYHKDPRFRNFGKTEGEKEKVFKQWLRDLGEKKRADANKAEQAFREMLGEDATIKLSDQWTEVKARFAKDARYGGVASASQREGLFEAHRKLLGQGSNGASSSKGAPASTSTSTTKPTLTKEERAARAAASLREREEQVRAEKERTSRQARAAKGNLGREEGEREFGTLLVDQVRDHNARWEEVVPFLSKDTRFTDSPLSVHDQRQLFDLHLKTLYSKRLAVVEDLFAQHASTMTTRFETILPSLADSLHVIRLVEKDYDRLEHLYEAWLRKWADRARREFDELLKESAILEHWGRLAKHEDLDKVKVMGEEGAEDSEDEDEMPSIVEMAKQVDLPAIQKVLRHDKRYLVFDHVSEKREQWLKEYLANLSAPKQTVHQKE
ncbi:BZ3500_MvSof-1268-A1-R1_Chr6-3g08893 [Microbotryum saponariae]|uniref:BZ3500_MvSof-1268-A1-R1_Chr6-3g08893 protein n=1 Tax=Microbotryum saponariae TaxID=289078 RepID=A0A2X0LK81_9BASI|nr:BZ3500_MvSof-1268-A1-R1_Chr6-3g08893 [Microbotryum saponariae]SDA07494.1 BZ3501_MvSof-1269-A2-R1_Chr6-2g08596 [Microbotryum saponariae]